MIRNLREIVTAVIEYFKNVVLYPSRENSTELIHYCMISINLADLKSLLLHSQKSRRKLNSKRL